MSFDGSDSGAVTVAAMYCFVEPEVGKQDLSALADEIRTQMSRLEVLGTVIIASEGLNATVAGSSGAVESFVEWLRMSPHVFGGLKALSPQYSFCDTIPFAQTVVKVRPEIVTMRAPDADPLVQVGQYVSAREWNALLDDPDVLVIDTRNQFEFELGTFASESGELAVSPGTVSFADFPAFVEGELKGKEGRTLALFCTGGIRCERATSYLLSRGFRDVRHLQGGILSYLRDIQPEDSRWQGGCFVFDERISLGHGLVPVSVL